MIQRLPEKSLGPEKVATSQFSYPTPKTIGARATVTESPFAPKKVGMLTRWGNMSKLLFSTQMRLSCKIKEQTVKNYETTEITQQKSYQTLQISKLFDNTKLTRKEKSIKIL